MRHALVLTAMVLATGCTTTEQYGYRINTAMTDIPIPQVEYNTPANKSMNGQGVVTLSEANLCADLEYQAFNGPLSHRRNLTGSIGTCDRQTGICAVYWLEYDACDIIDTADIAVDRRFYTPPTAQEKLDSLYQAVEDCHNGGKPRFGPMAPCEVLEDQYYNELDKQQGNTQ